jgi:hypothetical protein
MENEELHKIAPRLSKIQKENSFKVPDGYFETLPQKLQERLHPDEKGSWLQRIMEYFKPHLALAGMMVGVFVIAFVGIKLFTPEQITDNEVVDTGIADALEYELNEMDEISLMQMLAETEKADMASGNDSEDDYADLAVEYLLNEGVSVETLMHELELEIE